VKLPARVWFVALFAALAIIASGCSSSGEKARETAQAQKTAEAQTASAVAETTAGTGAAETLQDIPFSLNTEQAIPPDFRAAYLRKAPIVVEFYKKGQDPYYPQGLQVDSTVDSYLQNLRSEYTQIEFFTYDIDNPGSTKGNREIKPGQYGTLAAQLGVGFTPFVATLAPQENGYLIENLFQGYVPKPVLDQALLDLSASENQSNTSDVDVTISELKLTDSGGGIDYFTVHNQSRHPVNLQGFSLRLLDPQTGDVNPDSPGVQINQEIFVRPNQSVSLGRVPDIKAGGKKVDGTFEGGQDLDLAPGDQVALLDSGGAVAATFTV
jgi:hypothetical protein